MCLLCTADSDAVEDEGEEHKDKCTQNEHQNVPDGGKRATDLAEVGKDDQSEVDNSHGLEGGDQRVERAKQRGEHFSGLVVARRNGLSVDLAEEVLNCGENGGCQQEKKCGGNNSPNECCGGSFKLWLFHCKTPQ